MAGELLGTLVKGRGNGALRKIRLGQTLDGHLLPSGEVLSEEDHTKGTMVERCQCPEASVENLAFLKVVLHAIHVECNDMLVAFAELFDCRAGNGL